MNVRTAIQRAIADRERGYGDMDVRIDEDALNHIVRVANGDVRSALNALELAVLTTPMEGDGSTHITLAIAEESIQSRVMQMDESLLYDMLSAFCKSLRGSDSDAALAWFARMLYGGVDPRIVMRRVIVHASEDVGMANPMAMQQAVAAYQALEAVGMPRPALQSPRRSSPYAKAQSPTPCSWPWSGRLRTRRMAAFSRCHNICAIRTIAARKSSAPERATSTFTIIPGHFVAQEYRPVEAGGFPYYVPSRQGYENDVRALRKTRGFVDPAED